MSFGSWLKRGVLAVGTGGLSEVDRAMGSPVGGFLEDAYGTPDKVSVDVDKADYSGVEWNPYASYLTNAKAYQFDPTQVNQSRGSLLGVQQGYQDVINGSAPSQAQGLLAQGNAQAAAQAQQIAASARGGPGASLLAQQQAQRTGAGLALAGNAQAAQLRAQEVAGARQGLAQVGGTLYGLDQQDQQMRAQNYQDFQHQQLQGQYQLAQGRAAVASQYATDKLNGKLGVLNINAQNERDALGRKAGLVKQVGEGLVGGMTGKPA